VEQAVDDFRLTDRQIAKLKTLHRSLRKRQLADRVKAVVLLGSGWSVAQVAQALLVDEATVRHWREKYQRGGENELLTLLYCGKAPSLTVEQQKELAKHLDKNTYLDSADIRRHIEKTYGVKYSPTGVKELLHRLGFVYKKPKHRPGKLDPEKQAAFIAEYEKLRENKGKNDPVYFGDACHPQFNSIPAYGWIRCGVDKELKSNHGRQRANINGAVDIDTLQVVADFSDSMS